MPLCSKINCHRLESIRTKNAFNRSFKLINLFLQSYVSVHAEYAVRTIIKKTGSFIENTEDIFVNRVNLCNIGYIKCSLFE